MHYKQTGRRRGVHVNGQTDKQAGREIATHIHIYTAPATYTVIYV